MKTVELMSNALDLNEFSEHNCESILDFVMEQFPGGMPETLRIYHEHISEVTDVTPRCEADFDAIQALPGPFYVVTYPGVPIAYVVYAVIVLLVVAVALSIKPKVPAIGNNQTQSSNNSLSDRSNQARPNSRIPDIFGTVNSVPDLIAVPYKIFINNIEVEYCYMCIGRGEHAVSNIQDDTTLISEIDGASVEIYAPFTSPNNTSAPQLRVGTPIQTPVLDVARYTSVNGQTLIAPDANTYYSLHWILNGSGNYKVTATENNVDFTTFFAIGDTVVLAFDPLSGGGDISGTYTIASSATDHFTLLNPQVTNAVWDTISATTTTSGSNGNVSNPAIPWIGPFIMPKPNATQLFLNVVAENGMYLQNNNGIYGLTTSYEIEVTPVDSANVPTGATATFTGGVTSGGASTTSKATTTVIDLPTTGRCSVRMRRTTVKSTFSGTTVDEIKWRDMYGVAPVSKAHFGDLTTVQSVTIATEGALSVKDRKLNMLVTRMLPTSESILHLDGTRTYTNTFSGSTATNDMADIACFMALDPRIGGRNVSELDVNGIYHTRDAVATYFGTSDCSSFCYTFDDTTVSFEESLTYVAAATFSTAFRRGNIISFSFEQETEDSLLLFNHRNKIPGSETRTVRFGNADNVDGVNYTWVDPVDESSVIYYIPEDQSAVNPKEITATGVRNINQAYLQAYRAWNKIQFQNTSTEFTGTDEGNILVINDRILVADNTRTGTLDGEIIKQDGLTLTLSQPTDTSAAGSEQIHIFLQLYDGTVQNLPCTVNPPTAVGARTTVTLSTAPRLPLVVGVDTYARTGYMITWDTKPRQQAFLVNEKSDGDNALTVKITAINYDSRYYQNDGDYIAGLVPADPLTPETPSVYS